LVAEFDNFRKRTVRERAQQTERAQADLVKLLLESLDDLARVSHMSSGEHKAAAILEGVQLVESKLLRALEAAGLEPINAVGQPFDPQVHEALVTVATDQPDEDDVVSQEIAKGYLFKAALLRPALVEVKKYQPAADADQG
jgi:molecular chaperone GrpE